MLSFTQELCQWEPGLQMPSPVPSSWWGLATAHHLYRHFTCRLVTRKPFYPCGFIALDCTLFIPKQISTQVPQLLLRYLCTRESWPPDNSLWPELSLKLWMFSPPFNSSLHGSSGCTQTPGTQPGQHAQGTDGPQSFQRPLLVSCLQLPGARPLTKDSPPVCT